MSQTGRIDRGRGHSYRLDGDPIDGVTTIIGDGVPKPALTNWAAKEAATFAVDHLEMLGELDRDAAVDLVKGAPWRDRDKAARRGSEVHALAERISRGEEVEVPDELIGHVDACCAFMADWQPEFHVLERPCFSRKHRYGGTFDWIAAIPRIGLCLGDWKTNRSGPFGEVGLQMAAYRHADFYLADDGSEVAMPSLDECVVVWLTHEGYELLPVQADAAVFRTFLYVQQVAHFQKVTSREVIGSALDRPKVEVAS